MRGVALTLLAFAVVALLLAWSRRLARRRTAALGHLLLATACAALAAVLLHASAALDGYQPLLPDRPLAEVRFDADGDGHYTAMVLRLPEGRVQLFGMPGDRWRLSVRTLAGSPAAARLGFPTSGRLYALESAAGGQVLRTYRLEGSGRYDAWASAAAGGPWALVATAAEIDTGWQPMADRGEYRLRLSGGRLLADPVPDGTTLAR